MFNLFKKKDSDDEYLKKVASILFETTGKAMSMQNSYGLATESLSELRDKISKGVFRDGPNPREVVMAYYSLCSMLDDARLSDGVETVVNIGVIAESLGKVFKTQSDLTPLEKGICLFGENAISEAFPTYSEESVAQVKKDALEIIIEIGREQYLPVSHGELVTLVDNVASDLHERDVSKAGGKVLALFAITNMARHVFDQGDIKMANAYCNCAGAALEKYVKGKMTSFTPYQADALKAMMSSYTPLLKSLMEANTKSM